MDRLVPTEELDAQALALATEIAASAPLAVSAIRATLRADLIERFRAALVVEAAKQHDLQDTSDFAEGVLAMRDRRLPQFTGT